MTTKVTIKPTAGDEFQIDVEPNQTLAELKVEISKSKGYATGAQNLIYAGRVFNDSQVFGTLGFKEPDFMSLLISKPRKTRDPPTAPTLTFTRPAKLLDQKPSSTSSPPSVKGKEVIRDDEQTGDVDISTNIPIVHQEQPTVPSQSIVPSSPVQTIFQPEVYSSSLAWKPPVPSQPIVSSPSAQTNFDPEDYAKSLAWKPPVPSQSTVPSQSIVPSSPVQPIFQPEVYSSSLAWKPPVPSQPIVSSPSAQTTFDPEDYTKSLAWKPPVPSQPTVPFQSIDPSPPAQTIFDPEDYAKSLAWKPPVPSQSIVPSPPAQTIFDPEDYAKSLAWKPPVSSQPTVPSQSIVPSSLAEAVFQPQDYLNYLAWKPPAPSQPTVPSPPQTIFQPQDDSSPLAWQPPVRPVLSQQKSNDAQGEGETSGNTSDFDSIMMTEMIRTNPSMRQKFLEIAGQHDPAFGQQLEEDPGLLDSILIEMASGMASDPVGREQQDSTLTADEKESVQYLTDLGFPEEKAIEAYLVSDKNKELAVDYLLSSNDESTTNVASESAPHASGEPSIEQLIREDPSFRQKLNQTIAQQNPVLAQHIKENPALFEAALQNSALQKHALTSDESRAVRRLEDLGFTKEKALEAYIICGKNEEHAVSYLIDDPDSTDDSGIAAASEENSQPIRDSTPQTTSRVEDSSSLSSAMPASDATSRTETIYLTAEEGEVIQRLMDCGFTEQQSLEAYLVSDKNEQIALNYLLDQA